MNPVTSEADVERIALDLFQDLAWSWDNVMDEVLGEHGTLGREHTGEVVLLRRLRPALEKLNPALPAEAIELAMDELTRDRSAMSLVQANREIYRLLKDGIQVQIGTSEDDTEGSPRVHVIDWVHPDANDFFVAQQLWVQGETYKRRADLVGFVNGLPLVFIELKDINHTVENAYRQNFHDYLSAIPQIFWFNAIVLLSNGFESRVGSLTGDWAHFAEWKRIEREDEAPRVSLEVILRGLCEKSRLLDIVENFTLFSEQNSYVSKIIGKNHQYLGVNNAIVAVQKYQRSLSVSGLSKEVITTDRRLGIFWHTQGSGISLSMVFFSQKVLRRIHGSWTFVIVTDREDLDTQIYAVFANCGVIALPWNSKRGEDKQGLQARSAEHLRRLLTEDHRYVFTTIQKFRTDRGATYPQVSNRSDIIVIADEAHRSQYGAFAQNLRHALPNAAFIGFTGTPLLVGEEKTREVFGDYVSVYNFRQAIEDRATVPLFYEARIPELQLSNEQISDEMAELLDEVDLDDEQQKVEEDFARQYHLITREDRLDTIATDIVTHFLGLERGTKAMIVTIDKVTAVRMYDKVKAAWAKRRAELSILSYDDKNAAVEQAATVAFMDATDMAVVVSQGQNEDEIFKKKGLDIAPHRRRMVQKDLDTQFKDPKDPLRIVFVCAMWLTGLDVPSCGVIYLDRPMKNQTLMQTISRANRVYEGKINGIIVDYVGVFKNLQDALSVYSTDSHGIVQKGDSPVQPIEVQLIELGTKIEDAKKYALSRSVNVDSMKKRKGLERLTDLRAGVDKLIHPPEVKKTYLDLAGQVDRIYRALGVDKRKNAYAADWSLLSDLARGIRGLQAPVDISKIMEAVEKLLDESVGAQAYVIRSPPNAPYGGRVHLGGIDFDALARFFAKTPLKASTAEAATVAARKKVDAMVRQNPTRESLRGQMEALIADYNDGAHTVDQFFKDLIELMKKVEAEEGRTVREGLSQEELAIDDLLVDAEVQLGAEEREALKKIARDLPKKLVKKLVIDWRKTQRGRAAVKATIKDVLEELPEAYGPEAYERVVTVVYDHVYESYWGEGKSKYGEGAAD